MFVKAFLLSATAALAFIAPGQPKTLASLNATVEQIDRIEINGKQVIVHFEMHPGRRYTIQASLAQPAAASNWVNLITLPVYPFHLHYAYPDNYTNAARYYRLRVQ